MLIQCTNIIVFRKRQLKETLDKNVTLDRKTQLSLVIGILDFFFYQDFLSRALATHRTAGEGSRPSFIPLYHFHPLTNIQAFTCNFAREMTITYF